MKTNILTLFLFYFFSSNAQVIEQFKHKDQDAEIILLPSDYVLPDSCTYVGKLKSDDPYLASRTADRIHSPNRNSRTG